MKKGNNLKSQNRPQRLAVGIQAKLFVFLVFLALIFSFVALIVLSAGNIERIQQDVNTTSILILITVFALSIYGGLIFVRKMVVGPLKSLIQTAQEISSGNLSVRAEVKSRDEIGVLAAAFNEMADRLAEYPEALRKTVQERTGDLVARNKELDAIAKALVRRDLELSEVRRKQEDQLIELDQVAKKLVRRDMALLKANDELLEIDKAKSHFVSVAAHQLRTPLSIIKWTFRMLVSGDFGPITKEQEKVIQRGYDVNEGMIVLISDLLDVARIESGRFLYRLRYISLEEIIKETFDMHLSSAKAKRIDFKLTKKSKGEMPLIFGDKSSLHMVMNNLITNALKYTLQGGKVDVIYRKQDKFIEVRVKDTGVGVPKYQVEQLFTKFFRGDNVVRMQTSGTGLGLFIARNIIRAHKGEIGVESKEGEGSEFWFRIPVKNSD